MKSFTLVVQDATRSEEIPGVTSFVGEDASGSFGVLAGHGRMMTSLIVGLARFRCAEDHWRYLAVPGAVLYFREGVLFLSTRRYLLDDDFTRINVALQDQLVSEEAKLHTMKESLHRMEEEMLRRMWEMGRGERF